MKKLGCFLVCLFVLSATQAFGSDITLFGGLQREGKLTLQNATSQVTSTTPSLITTNPHNFGTFGLRLGIGKKVIGMESTLAYSPNFLSSSAKAVILNHNLMLQVPTPVVKPYVTAGLGTVITVTKNSTIPDIGSKFAVNYGGGLKAMFGPVGGRLDVRGYSLPSVQSQTLNVIEVSLGVVFGF